MDLRQLRSLVALAESGLSVTRAAAKLHVVQSAVSQHLSRLEREVGADIFVRQGKRLVGFTAAGDKVLHHARKAIANAESILAIGSDEESEAGGILRVGTTHTQARYVLPPVLRAFRGRYPDTSVQIHQSTPDQLVDMAASNKVDIAIYTEGSTEHPDLVALRCYRWNRSLIAPCGHPIFERKPLSLEALCEYPLITYVYGVTGGSRFQNSFSRIGLDPQIVLSAADADVIKTYVRDGFGVGIISSLAYSPATDGDLEVRDLRHLFPWETTRVAYHRDKYLRRYEEGFIELLQTTTGETIARK